MVIEMLLNSDIQKKIYSNDFTFSKRNTCNYITLFRKKKIKCESFHLEKISIKYKFSIFF